MKFEAESVGVLEALSWTKDLPNQPIVIESDSLLCVNAINRVAQNLLELGSIIEQCQHILANRVDVSVVFTRKQA